MLALINTRDGAAIFGLFVTLWLAGLLIWRRYLHPLSRYPGPFFHTVSEVPLVIGLLTGKSHTQIKKLHDKYGPVVRISPNELSFCGAGAWEDIYGFRTYDQPMEKDPIWVGVLNTELGAQPLTYAPRKDHGRQRRALSHPFSNTACIQQEPLIRAQIDKFISKMTHFATTNQAVNMTHWFSFLGLDIIGELCFAAPFGCLDALAPSESGENIAWAGNMNNAKQYGVYLMASRRIAGPGTWLQKLLVRLLVPKRYRQGMMKHFEHSKEKVTARLQDGPQRDHKDFIYYILRNNESKRLLSETEILLNSSLFIGAGSDTTASVLTAAIYVLATHPKVYSILAHEIRTACPTPSSVTWSMISSNTSSNNNSSSDDALPYLTAFLSETMRLFTPITCGHLRTVPVPLPPNSLPPAHLRKKQRRDSDPHTTSNPPAAPFQTYIDTHGPIPPGTTVSAHHYTSTRSTLNWTRPAEFLPERWLEPSQFPHDKRHASQPFSLGPRGCIGKNLSVIEQRLVLCSFLVHFDFELEGGSAEVGAPRWGTDPVTGEWRDIRAYLAWEQPDLMVRLRKRDVDGGGGE